MTQPVLLQFTRRTATLIHGAMVTGVVLIIVVFVFLRQAIEQEPYRDLVLVFRIVALAELVFAAILIRVVRHRMAPFEPAGDEAEWWRAHLAQAVIIWALAEGAALLGAILWFLTADVALLVGVAGVALALLVLNHPRALLGV
ncbi:MAG: hypothetical protein GTN62_08280 [Gemmatimonadales bacterium]|nr:hypothetical protein [Gemmatimonadales bacterium]NIN50097.1 hypothetical protein [Gemmatimonadales bacterium]NIP07561.1 hypothetical protein [Gemmatimonadales bacterium]NIR01717.1 hypothetical protein [Gemmatimonadales bacterium]NIS65620.1 hypothetical protein [Gemmatimonadales bacterium]